MTFFEGFTDEMEKIAQGTYEAHAKRTGIPVATHKKWWSLKPKQRTWGTLKKIRAQETPSVS